MAKIAVTNEERLAYLRKAQANIRDCINNLVVAELDKSNIVEKLDSIEAALFDIERLKDFRV